jgi:hypothetical protein
MGVHRVFRFGGGTTGDWTLGFVFFRCLTTRNTAKTATTAATPSPMSKIVAKLENSELMVCDTRTVLVSITGLALNQPELLLNCQVPAAVMSWLPMYALVGMRTAASIILFMPAVRLNGKPEVIWRVPLDQKSDANEILVTLMVN